MNKPQFMKQGVMIKVLYALTPVALTAIFFFGWRIAVLILISNIFAFLTEWIMSSKRNGRISQACFVTATIYSLSLPPLTPFWIAASGAVIAVLFGKEVFGGFGKNIFNPAVVGRAFVYVAFPIELTSQFVPVFKGIPGGFTEWSFPGSNQAAELIKSSGIKAADVITAATPMWSRRDFSYNTGLKELFTGSIGDTFQFGGFTKSLAAGSAGEVSAAVIILSAIYLIWTRTAQWRLIISTIAGAVILNLVLHYTAGINSVPDLPFTLFSGGLLYASVFMVTDPISAPKDKTSQWIYGIFIGVLIVFFRYRSIFAGGVAFSILFGNMIAPSLDLWIARYRKSRIRKEKI